MHEQKMRCNWIRNARVMMIVDNRGIKWMRGRIGGTRVRWLRRGAERVKRILGGEEGRGQASKGKIGGRGV